MSAPMTGTGSGLTYFGAVFPVTLNPTMPLQFRRSRSNRSRPDIGYVHVHQQFHDGRDQHGQSERHRHRCPTGESELSGANKLPCSSHRIRHKPCDGRQSIISGFELISHYRYVDLTVAANATYAY